jgi:hypothetical protein
MFGSARNKPNLILNFFCVELVIKQAFGVFMVDKIFTSNKNQVPERSKAGRLTLAVETHRDLIISSLLILVCAGLIEK